LGFISGTFNLVLTLFGVFFVAVYLLVNIRNVKATYLRIAPVRYRRDARELWDNFAFSLSRYLSGLGLVAFIQGALSAVALFFLGVPYAILLGTWVSITSIHPLPRGLSRCDPRRHPGPLRVADHRGANGPRVPHNSAAGGQHPDPSDPGTHSAGPVDPDLPGRHRRRRDRGAHRRHLRRADRGRAQGPLRLLPRSPSHQKLA